MDLMMPHRDRVLSLLNGKPLTALTLLTDGGAQVPFNLQILNDLG